MPKIQLSWEPPALCEAVYSVQLPAHPTTEAKLSGSLFEMRVNSNMVLARGLRYSLQVLTSAGDHAGRIVDHPPLAKLLDPLGLFGKHHECLASQGALRPTLHELHRIGPSKSDASLHLPLAMVVGERCVFGDVCSALVVD